ncbi:MAG: enoyl-CoA hydratase/isomerase family protein [Alicyclobacillus sp.]|nr:enoyl-CoA hydratase/isomerase family protein [Alicyclobacillus sp.]
MISLSKSEHIAVVTIDRPPVNALSDEAYQRLIEVFQDVSTDLDIHVVVLTAAGTRAFCAGTDINYFSLRHTDDPLWHERHSRLVREAFKSIYRCPVPVIAAVQSAAVGAGIGIIASCDIVIAAESASFGLPEIDRGVLGGARHLRRLISEGAMRYLAFTGERVTAREFLALGGVYRVVPDSELLPTAMDVARVISEKSPVSVRTLKAGLNHIEMCDLNLEEGYRYEQSLTGSIAHHPHSQEAARAFFEKRKPSFTG